MGVNSVTLVGRAGRDPEVRYFESGSVVANLTIAVNRRSRDDEPDWFNLEIWGKQAQVAADYVRKGSLLGIIGFKLDRWTTATVAKSAASPWCGWTASNCSAPSVTTRRPAPTSAVAARWPTRRFPSEVCLADVSLRIDGDARSADRARWHRPEQPPPDRPSPLWRRAQSRAPRCCSPYRAPSRQG